MHLPFAGCELVIFSPQKLTLHLHEHFSRHDRLVRVFYIVLRECACILHLFFGQEVNRVSFLQEQVAHILFILQHGLHRAGVPFLPSGTGLDPVILKALDDLPEGQPFEEVPEDPSDDIRFFWHDLQVAVLLFCVSEEPVVLQHRSALLETVLDAHPDVLGNALRFLLGNAGHDRDEELALCIHCIDIFFFKQDRNAEGFQLPDVLQAV